MNYILFDDKNRSRLLPLVFTRPVADIRVGIMTIREKWEFTLKQKTSSLTQNYLGKKFPLLKETDNLLLNGAVLPSASLLAEIEKLAPKQSLYSGETLIALRMKIDEIASFPESEQTFEKIHVKSTPVIIENTWDIFSKNAAAIESDFEILTRNRKSSEVGATNFILGDKSKIFIEQGATVEFAYLNTNSGPIYIGKDATVMEGSKIRGPFALGEHATIKMDAKIYEGTTVGPHCKVGGEVQNSVFFGYSNKGHDGYLGNAVVGEWCNFGADTNNSNLKNTYDIVKLWSYQDEKFVSTGLQFCGLIMGDHSKTGINTMFNTGTVVGVSCNIFGAGYQRNFLPSFSWGGPAGMHRFNLKKAFEVNEAVMSRRGLMFDETEKEILSYLYENS
jgi:UDP-N-acetylglucosamine diphosphorylase/glucosamine-1-phosphate N-acetyltransferase